jgi:hypothetical protein
MALPEELLTPDQIVTEPVAQTEAPPAPEPVAEPAAEPAKESEPEPAKEPEVAAEPEKAPEKAPEAAPEAAPVAGAKQEEYVSAFTELSKVAGSEITSFGDIVGALKEYSQLKSDPFKGVSPALREAIEAEKKGIPPATFFSVTSVDPDKMTAKDLLRRKFHLENPTLASEDPEFADMKFEADYEAKFSILGESRAEDDFDRPEQYQRYLNERKFAEKALSFESKQAKGLINDWKAKALAVAPAEEGPSQEDIEAANQRYTAETELVMSKLSDLPVKVSDKETFNVALTKAEKEQVKGYLADPSKFLSMIGFGSDTLNQAVFAQAVAWLVAKDSVGERLAVQRIESKNKEVVTRKIENPSSNGVSVKHPDGFVDDLAEAAAMLRGK